jgi:capsular polysaccharide biosynthesis protein
VHILFDEAKFRRPLPVNYVPEDQELFRANEQSSWPIYHDILFGVKINHELFVKYNLAKILQISFGHPWQNDKYNTPLYLLKNGIKDTLRLSMRINELVWFLDQFSTGGYYHWLTEILPRLWVANEVQKIPMEIPTCFPAYFFTKWNFGEELLRPFKRKYFKYNPSELLRVKKLHFISQPGGPLNFQPIPLKEANKILLNFYYQSEFPGNYEKVYISRNKGDKRLLINEDEILPAILNDGYKVVYTERLSVTEQINIFSRAKNLISIHGAGLTNMVFMPERSRILEIRNALPDHMNNCFLALADTLKHNYYYFIAEMNQMTSERRPKDASLRINPEKFKECLNAFSA